MSTRFRRTLIVASMGVASAVAVALLGVPSAASAEEELPAHTIWVDGEDGSDSNAGTEAAPFKTMERARDKVRTLNGSMAGDILVNIAAGDYYVQNPIEFTETDSGKNGHRVIYSVAPGEDPGSARFIGGKAVTSAWSLVQRTGADADLPAAAAGHVYRTQVGTEVDINTIYVDDTRATMARTPNRNPDPRFPSSRGDYLRSTGGGVYNLSYKADDIGGESLTGLLNAQARDELDAQVFVWNLNYRDWMTDTVEIGSINATTRNIQFASDEAHPELNRARYWIGGSARYFVQGNLGFLDQAGEYYFNKTTGVLYYYPLDGAAPSSGDVVIPTVKKIIDLAGSTRQNRVENITFDGLAFTATAFPAYYSYAWNYDDGQSGMEAYPPEAAGSTLPSYSESSERPEFQQGALTLTNTSNITIKRVHVRNAGLFGIALYLANDHTTIDGCLIEHTGLGGVSFEGGYPGTGGDATGQSYNNNNLLDDSIIHDVGELAGHAVGVTVNNATANTISHTEIYNSPRRAILLIGGWQRNTDPTTPHNDLAFNRMTDLYAHHNRFEHVYIHDSQQDGGDDGAFFGVFLFRGPTDHKPNYIDQMLIDDIGAHPSMTDFAPNGMNLDMGASGLDIRNFKAVNPQNFNTEVNTITQINDRILMTNTNIDFGSHTNQLAEFDDSLMEYDEIGPGDDLPEEYRPDEPEPEEPSDVYFEDDFEARLDLSKWTYRGKKPLISTAWMSEGVRAGKSSLEIFSDNAPAGSKPVLVREFGQSLDEIVTVKMFDRASNNLADYLSGRANAAHVRSFAHASQGAHGLGIGFDTAVNNTRYLVRDGASETVTTVPRTYGWHELTWDFTDPSTTKMYIDGVLVKTTSAISSFDRLELGVDDGRGISYFDEVSVHGGAGTTGSAPALTPPPPNLAETAVVTASGQLNSVYSRRNVIDDLTGMTGRGEWASNSGLTGWIELSWPTAQVMNQITLNERANMTDRILGGRLIFGDGTWLDVPTLPNDGSPFTVRFPDKLVDRVKFEVTSAAGYVAGLAEFAVFANGTLPHATHFNVAPHATVSASSQYSAAYAPGKAVDGIWGQTGVGEWAKSASDAAPSIRLTWPTRLTTDKIVLRDRPNSTDRITAATLKFSDGSTKSVTSLPNDGSASTITFPAKTVEWVELKLDTYTGLPGLSEFEVYDAHADLATTAAVTASSEYSSTYAATKVADGKIGQTGVGEWAAQAADAQPTVRLEWPYQQRVNKIVLHDRANSTDWIENGELTFSDGSTIAVSGIPNAGAAKVVTFPAKNVTWVQFRATTKTGLPGLSEFGAYHVVNEAAAATASASSVYSAGYAAGKLIDGVTGQTGVGEWAKAGSDTAPWAELQWADERAINQVILYDRPNSTDWVKGGTLLFSDGSQVAVPALDNAGGPTLVTFPSKVVDSVRFTITSYAGLAGLAEFAAYAGYLPEPDGNLARYAVVSATSQYSASYAASNVADGTVKVHGVGEWAAAAADADPAVTLTWSNPRTLTKIVLHDRPNNVDRVTGGSLAFSDGSVVSVGALPNDGSPLEITFPARTVSSVTFHLDQVTGLAGLSEFEAF